MSTSLVTGLDALTGPTSSGSFTNASDSAPNTMGCNITGTDGSSGFTVAFSTLNATSLATTSSVMTVNWAGLLVPIPLDAQIYRVELSAAVSYNVIASATYSRTAGSGIVTGTADADVSISIGAGGAYTPTTNTSVNVGDSQAGSTTVGSFGITAQVTGTPTLAKDFVFTPAGSNPDAPLGYITRAALLSHFTNLSVVTGPVAFPQIVVDLNNGNYSLSATIVLQVSLFIMRVYWNSPIPTSFPMAIPTISAAPLVHVGSDITINDPTGNLHDTSSVVITLSDGTALDIPLEWIWVWTNTTITFTIPYFLGSYEGIISIAIVSNFYGGFVTLGTSLCQYENATGLYELNYNLSIDIEYVRTYDNTPLNFRLLVDESEQEYFFLKVPGITPLVIIPEPIGYIQAYVDVDGEDEPIIPFSTLQVTTKIIKIPNPFARTAFIGG